MERKKRFVSIHQDMKDRKKEDEDSDDDDLSPSVNLASQYLADSSLSEDVSQYFSMSGTVGVRSYSLESRLMISTLLFSALFCSQN